MKYTHRIIFIYAILLLAVLLSYSNSIFNSFVYDDASVVSNNPRIHHLSNIQHLFTPQYFTIVDIGKETAFGEASYRPIVTLSYFVDAFLWDARNWGCHLTNILLHICVVLLLFMALRYISNTVTSALLGSLFFAVHPLLTEPIDAIAFREDILAALFCLAGLLCFVKKTSHHSTTKKTIFDLLHSFFFLLGLLSKEMVITYPVLVLGICYLKRMPLKRHRVLLGVFAGVTILYLALRFGILVNPEKTIQLYPGGTFLTNIYTMSTVWMLYLKKLFWPVNLLVDYAVQPQYSLFSLRVLSSIVFISATFIFACTVFIKRRSAQAMGTVCFFIALLPVSNIIPIANIAAERYMYFPMIGIAISCSILFARLFSMHRRWSILLYTVIMVCFCIIICMRNADWKNSITLWRSAIRVEPKSARAYSSLGTEYFEAGRYKKALKHYLKCISLRNSSQDNYNIGNCYRKIGDFEQAVESYQKAIGIDPTFAEYYENLALSLTQLGKYDAAEVAFQNAMKYGRLDDTLYENMGLLYDSMKQYEKALTFYRKALDLNPNRPTAINKIALVYIKTGNPEKGIELFMEGMKQYPRFVTFYKNLATWYEMQEEWNDAIYYWEKAYTLTPDDHGIIVKLIKLCALAGDEPKQMYYRSKIHNGVR